MGVCSILNVFLICHISMDPAELTVLDVVVSNDKFTIPRIDILEYNSSNNMLLGVTSQKNFTKLLLLRNVSDKPNEITKNVKFEVQGSIEYSF